MVTPDKPRLRGVLHLAAFVVTLVAGAWLVSVSQPRFFASVVVYVAALALQLGTSALYHRPTWAPGPRQWLRRCDHATIFVLIAGTATPIAMSLDPTHRRRLLAILWIGAAVGVVRAIVWITAPKWVVTLIAVMLGGTCFAFVPVFSAALDGTTVWLLIVGGVVYILGAATYALKRPDPWPRWFGYHETFHALTIVAGVLDFVAVARIAR